MGDVVAKRDGSQGQRVDSHIEEGPACKGRVDQPVVPGQFKSKTGFHRADFADHSRCQ